MYVREATYVALSSPAGSRLFNTTPRLFCGLKYSDHTPTSTTTGYSTIGLIDLIEADFALQVQDAGCRMQDFALQILQLQVSNPGKAQYIGAYDRRI
jgi:hypothetical protein